MDSRLLAYAERQAPRYTSYPTAPHFSAQTGDSAAQEWLSELDRDASLSLYLHVPFCRQLCWYCGCNTYAARRDEPVLDFVDTLLAEIDLVSSFSSAKRVTEIHWGGGTPNILSPEQFKRIAERLAQRFDLSDLAAHAIELDPRYVDAAKAEAYAAAGVNRVSFGVQDLNERVQQAIGRVQPLDIVARAVEFVRQAGIDEINVDLMYGLPHQTVDDLRNSIRLAAGLNPNRVALFGYAHVPWFKKRQRLIPEASLPGAGERFEQAAAAQSELETLGYVAIGLDHFALPADELARAAASGALRRSFQGYVVQEADAIVGLGPSAISTLPQGYAQNAPEPGAWAQAILQGKLATVRGHALSADDRIRRRLIEQIMCDFEGDLAPLGGAAACADELAALTPMLSDGMVRIEGDKVQLSPEAQPFCRLVGMAFDAYAARGAARHSRAV
ncbi:oxygen-independent coproporphyrinogen III oxidase [Terricaulis sp.]|uniref:oxygen-independent coproporphyrinogen III oxidase n=1 Tax=Terricaulis sp. TaxID=2768686 RepID=UPI003783293A